MDKRQNRLPHGSPLGRKSRALDCPATLYHEVVGVGNESCCLGKSLVAVAGDYIFNHAFAVESDSLDLKLFAFVVGGKRSGCVVVYYVGHDLKV